MQSIITWFFVFSRWGSSKTYWLFISLSDKTSANTKHLHNICPTSLQRRRRWSNILQMLHKCFVFTGTRSITLKTPKNPMFCRFMWHWFHLHVNTVEKNTCHDQVHRVRKWTNNPLHLILFITIQGRARYASDPAGHRVPCSQSDVLISESPEQNKRRIGSKAIVDCVGLQSFVECYIRQMCAF